MLGTDENLAAVVPLLRVLFVPLCAAFVAALAAHIGIDVFGDYLLPHDAYDDVAHGSRTLVLGLVLATLAALSVCGFSTAIREARGSVEDFSQALRSSLAFSIVPFVAIATVAATTILLAMEAFDALSAGRAIDDFGDLFGGSMPLGVVTVVLCAILSSLGVRLFVRALAGVRRSLVAVLTVVFAERATLGSLATSLAFLRKRISAKTHLTWRSRSGRAPPRSNCSQAFFS